MGDKFLYLSRSLSRSRLWLRTGDCPLVMEWWEIGGDALAGLEEEVVEVELLVERSKPLLTTLVPVLVLPMPPLLPCLMPLSSMVCPPPPPPPVTSFHSCWSSAGLRPPVGIQEEEGVRGTCEITLVLTLGNVMKQPDKFYDAAEKL